MYVKASSWPLGVVAPQELTTRQELGPRNFDWIPAFARATSSALDPGS